MAVAVDAPLHAALSPTLSYFSERPLLEGTLVHVPLGQREVAGIVWSAEATDAADSEVRLVVEVCDAIAPLSAPWRALAEFTAAYYQRSLGEIALSALPVELRRLRNAALVNRLARAAKTTAAQAGGALSPV
ncbi:MAG: primosomal protein N', partial [Caldimonas sp.]